MRLTKGILSAAALVSALVVGAVIGYGAGFLFRPDQPDQRVSADMILTNAKVYVLDDRSPSTNVGRVVQAMAVREGRVMSIGSNAEIARLAGPATVKLDLGGRAVIPGLIDTHSHLMDYAIDHWATDVKRSEVEAAKGETWQSVKGKVLSAVSTSVREARSGEWISVNIPREALGSDGQPLDVKLALRQGLITREELDRMAPQNPIHIQGSTRAVLNTKAIDLVSPLTDEPGVIEPRTGFSQNTVNRIVKSDFLMEVKALAEAYAKEHEEWAAYGITTWSSSLRSLKALAAYEMLDSQGREVIRFAYGPSIGTAPERLPVNSAGLAGYGSSFLWYNSVSSSGPDGSYPEIATTVGTPEIPKSIKQREKFEDEMFPLIEAAVAKGLRWANTHVAGDRTLDALMDAIERGSQRAGLSLEQIRAKRHATDHCAVNPRADQIPRMAKLGMFASCSPKYLENTPTVAKDYGEARTRWVVPVKSLIDGGVRTVLELDTHDIGRNGFFYFLDLLVNRELDGKVWVPEERIDRVLAMKMSTVWASEYLFREREIGSLEPGKWADFVVLDRDYFDRQGLPDRQIKAVRPLMTAIGGKIRFLHLSLTTELGMNAVGIQPRYR